MTSSALSPRDKDAHKHILAQAEGIGSPLKSALEASGAIAMPKRRRNSLFGVLARAIVGQQLSSKAAATIWSRLAEGAELSGKPLPLYLETTDEETLRGFGLSRGKAGFLAALSDAERSGHLSARRVNAMTHEERRRYLTRIKGIGDWTADMVGIFYCLDADVWPQGDLAVRRVISRLSGREEDALPDLVERFRPYRSYVALQMWHLKRENFQALP